MFLLTVFGFAYGFVYRLSSLCFWGLKKFCKKNFRYVKKGLRKNFTKKFSLCEKGLVKKFYKKNFRYVKKGL